MHSVDPQFEPYLDPSFESDSEDPLDASFESEAGESGEVDGSLAREVSPERARRSIASFLLPLVRSMPRTNERAWSVEALAGRTIELSSPAHGPAASFTAAASLLLACQLGGEAAVWVASGAAIFHPGDLGEFGVDLAALPVVRAPDAVSAARAAERLLRSGGLGLLVLDLVDAGRRAGQKGTIDAAVLSRLAGLARHHHTALLALTQKSDEASSLGSLVSLRAEATVRKTAFDRFEWGLRILKDKRQGSGWSHAEVCRGSDGLC
ncbi:MAG: recombinase A [Candidatus Eisenbacteria bacterium]